MTLQLATLETAVSEFELHAFELAYVLSLMQVESVVALPDAVLFPEDLRLRKKVLSEGEKRLIAHGWIQPSDQPGEGAYQEELLRMAATVADPRFVILTRRETSQGERADATIYFNQVEIVEVTQTDRQVFRLRRLPDSMHAFHKVRKLLGVSPQPENAEAVTELRIEEFEKTRKHIAANEIPEAVSILVEAGLPPQTAESFVADLGKPQRKGVVSILKHAAQKVTDVRALGFYLGDGGTWLTSVVSESTHRVRVEAVDTESFIRRLVERVASIC